jgi:hypothetical protein
LKGSDPSYPPTLFVRHNSQDDVHQAWEDLLLYSEFSVRLPKSRIAALPELLASIPDKDYLQLRAGMAVSVMPLACPMPSSGNDCKSDEEHLLLRAGGVHMLFYTCQNVLLLHCCAPIAHTSNIHCYMCCFDGSCVHPCQTVTFIGD